MATNLQEASKQLPKRVRDWEDGSFFPVAELRRLAGFPLYRDMKDLLQVGAAISKKPVDIPESTMETAKVLRRLWRFRHRARAFRGFFWRSRRGESMAEIDRYRVLPIRANCFAFVRESRDRFALRFYSAASLEESVRNPDCGRLEVPGGQGDRISGRRVF
jgi:hypothetical protein